MKLAGKDIDVFLPNISNTLSTYTGCLSIVWTHGESASGRASLPYGIYCIFWDIDSFSFLTNHTFFFKFFFFLNREGGGGVLTIMDHNLHTVTIYIKLSYLWFCNYFQKSLLKQRSGGEGVICNEGNWYLFNLKTIYFYWMITV